MAITLSKQAKEQFALANLSTEDIAKIEANSRNKSVAEEVAKIAEKLANIFGVYPIPIRILAVDAQNPEVVKFIGKHLDQIAGDFPSKMRNGLMTSLAAPNIRNAITFIQRKGIEISEDEKVAAINQPEKQEPVNQTKPADSVAGTPSAPSVTNPLSKL